MQDIKQYLYDIGNYELSDDDYSQLWKKVKSGDKDARDELVNRNLKLVVSIAKKYYKCGLPLDDIIQEGNLGLIRSIKYFDESLGYRFSTYASYWIKQAILRAIANQSRTIRLPTHAIEKITKIQKAETELKECNQDSISAIAKKVGMSEKEVLEYYAYMHNTLSLDESLDDGSAEDSNDNNVYALIEDPNQTNPEEIVLKDDLKDTMANLLGTLEPRESDIIRMRYGFVDGKMYTLEEIGKRHNLTRERIRQIETRAMQKLNLPSRKNRLLNFVNS